MRCSFLCVLSVAFLLITGAPSANGDTTPNFSGTWQLDSSKSEGIQGAAITLVIKEEAGNIDFRRTLREGDGKEVVFSFVCGTAGSECDSDESGHKAKVSLWYAGSALMILKTEGPKQDATTERKLELSPEGKVLTVQFSNLAGTNKPEKLVFLKR